MPKLAAFPKGFIKQLVSGQMSIFEWIKLADELRVDGQIGRASCRERV